MAEKVDRLTRVNELLKREIADLIERGLVTAPNMLVSVTEVCSSVDLRNATVYISIFGGAPGDRRRVMKELEDSRIDLQRKIARTLGFKHTPVLLFKQDARTELGDRVFTLLNSTKKRAETAETDEHE